MQPFWLKAGTLRGTIAMRGVVFQLCLIAGAGNIEIDAAGTIFFRRPTSGAGVGSIAVLLEDLRNNPDDVEVAESGRAGGRTELRALKKGASTRRMQRPPELVPIPGCCLNAA